MGYGMDKKMNKSSKKIEMKVGMIFVYGGKEHKIVKITKNTVMTNRCVWDRGGLLVVLNNPDYYL